jgi:hypothetical protein
MARCRAGPSQGVVLVVGPGAVAVGCVAVGVVAAGVVVVPVGVAVVPAGGVVATELVTAGGAWTGGGTPSAGAGAEVVAVAGGASRVSWTKATASAAPASTTTIASSAAGMRQFGDGARRVRAGAPHSTHQSWSGCSGAPQRGQLDA